MISYMELYCWYILSMSSPNIANLRRQLNRALARQRQALVMTWLTPAPGSRGHRNPMGTPGYNLHTNLTLRVIPNLRRQIKAAEAKAAAKRRWNAVRRHVTARGIVEYMHAASMRPPTRGGAGYERLMRATVLGRPNTRNVGTSTSPRRTPSPARSRSPPKNRSPRSPGRSPRR
jgi:hypothetical protein